MYTSQFLLPTDSLVNTAAFAILHLLPVDVSISHTLKEIVFDYETVLLANISNQNFTDDVTIGMSLQSLLNASLLFFFSTRLYSLCKNGKVSSISERPIRRHFLVRLAWITVSIVCFNIIWSVGNAITPGQHLRFSMEAMPHWSTWIPLWIFARILTIRCPMRSASMMEVRWPRAVRRKPEHHGLVLF